MGVHCFLSSYSMVGTQSSFFPTTVQILLLSASIKQDLKKSHHSHLNSTGSKLLNPSSFHCNHFLIKERQTCQVVVIWDISQYLLLKAYTSYFQIKRT